MSTDTRPSPRKRLWMWRWSLLLTLVILGISFVRWPEREFVVPEFETGGTVKVLVTNEDGDLIPDAQLTPYALRSVQVPGTHWIWSELEHGPQDGFVTDADGVGEVTFPKWTSRQDGLLTGTVTLAIEHPDYYVGQDFDVKIPQPGQASTPPKLQLKRGGRVRIKAVRAGESTPLQEFETQVSQLPFGRWKTDGDWRVSPVIEPGTRLMRVVDRSDPNKLQFSKIVSVELELGKTQDVTVQLTPTVTVRGQLDASVPRPVRHGFVVATSFAMQGIATKDALQWQTWTSIDEVGNFEFASLPDLDEVRLIAWCDGYVSQMPSPATIPLELKPFVRSGARQSLPQIYSRKSADVCQIKMEPTANVEVTVRDRQGNAVPGVAVYLNPNMVLLDGSTNFGSATRFDQHLPNATSLVEFIRLSNQEPELARSFGAKTDDQGKVSIDNIPARGAEYVSVYHSSFVVQGRRRPPFESNLYVKLESGKTATANVTVVPKPKLTSRMLAAPPPPTSPWFVKGWWQLRMLTGL